MSDDDQNKDDASGLRKQYEEALAELKTLKRDLFTRDVGDVLGQYGLTADTPAAKLALKSYDGDLKPEAFSSWLSEQGFEPAEQTTQQEQLSGLQKRVEQQQELSTLREQSQPATGQRVTREEFTNKMISDPDEARRLHAEGLVDLSV